ncbi:thioredoxin domain-containing protein [Methylobacter luteus]|uniref:thioredoxin domain-containing protein n=1 Tax=Methylobacter luteus TaxID=415 RepID=UPI0003FFBD58|nr:thioredoxin domain-containing protein [Methylobacter luteus]
MPSTAELKAKLAAALEAKGPNYQPRTHHLENGKPIYTNRLIFEDSPYLLQHAHNPVDWFPWGDEAFAIARLENKPVFLSIGYATCHWCHVMEEESFESLYIAKILNDNFISIKVDREQYPDIDQIYMTAVTMMTGHGGWPMSSFLTHQGKPFFGGTYYPAETFADLLLQIIKVWISQQRTLIDQAEQLADAVNRVTATQRQLSKLDVSSMRAAVDQLLEHYDAKDGGFSPAPKFPSEPALLMLLQAYERNPEPALFSALNHTLSAMAQGGIYDQIGGGFHRYATDKHWLVPHFEKMLYNQAYLARVYAHAYNLTGNPIYARIVKQTLDYVLREITTPEGVFYSATDADSEGHEGTFFIWTIDEVKTVLSPDDAAFIIKTFGLTPKGNFEGKNIFHLPRPLDEVAKEEGISLEQLFNRLDPMLETLRRYRVQRIPPLTDNKIIVAWNAMLITALAEAGDRLAEPRYIDAAKRAAGTLWKKQRPKDGVLWRVSLDNKSSISARQDDYAHLSEALLALYDISGDPLYLQQAQALVDEMLEKFLDSVSGALVMGRERLLFHHPKDSYDGALPSGNAVAVRVLSRLARRTGETAYADHAARIVQAFADGINRQPSAYAYLLAQFDEMQNGETGPRQYAARGAVKIEAKRIKQLHKNLVTVDLEIKEGWHINAHEPLQQTLVATELGLADGSAWTVDAVTYPEPVLRTLPFDKNPLALYEGRVHMRAELSRHDEEIHEPVKLNLQFQACDQEACQAPETVILTVY